MKIKVVGWLDTRTMTPFWGLQAKLENGQKAFVCECELPLFYRTENEARAKLKELNKAEKERKEVQ